MLNIYLFLTGSSNVFATSFIFNQGRSFSLMHLDIIQFENFVANLLPISTTKVSRSILSGQARYLDENANKLVFDPTISVLLFGNKPIC